MFNKITKLKRPKLKQSPESDPKVKNKKVKLIGGVVVGVSAQLLNS